MPPTVRVTAREKFPYAGIDRRVGESFEATVDDARILHLVGRVDIDPEQAAIIEQTTESHQKPGRPKRNYRRRDLTAETE